MGKLLKEKRMEGWKTGGMFHPFQPSNLLAEGRRDATTIPIFQPFHLEYRTHQLRMHSTVQHYLLHRRFGQSPLRTEHSGLRCCQVATPFSSIPCFLLYRQTPLCNHASLRISIFTRWRVGNLFYNLLYTQNCEGLSHHTVGKTCYMRDIHESVALVDEQPIHAGCNGGCLPIGKPLFYDSTRG